MSFFMMKSLLSVALLVTAAVALGAMMSLMGRKEHRRSPDSLRMIHRVWGYVSVVLVVVIGYLCVRHVASVGDAVPTRGVIHGVLALFLIVGIVVKIAIVRSYRQFLKYAPVLGMVLFSLIFVVVATSAGFLLVRTWCSPAEPPVRVVGEAATESAETGAGVDDQEETPDAELGRSVYARHCAGCHPADSEKPRVGPGLKGLMRRERFVSVDAPVTVAGVMQQIVQPAGSMPAFGDRLSDAELTALLAYIQTL